jgi:hypothetical protein
MKSNQAEHALSPGELAHYHLKEHNLSKFNNMNRFFRMTGYQVETRDEVKVLSLACGDCEEAAVVSAFFSSGIYGFPSRKAGVWGIDRDASAIERARRYAQLPPFSQRAQAFLVPPRCEFTVGEPAKLDRFPGLPARLDVVMLRQACAEFRPENWKRLLDAGVSRLASNGVFFFTSNSGIAHERLLELLRSRGLNVLADEKNPYSVAARDRFVTLANREDVDR